MGIVFLCHELVSVYSVSAPLLGWLYLGLHPSIVCQRTHTAACMYMHVCAYMCTYDTAQAVTWAGSVSRGPSRRPFPRQGASLHLTTGPSEAATPSKVPLHAQRVLSPLRLPHSTLNTTG